MYCYLEGKISLKGRPEDFSLAEISRSYFGAGGTHGLD
jgi:hypothetical protein